MPSRWPPGPTSPSPPPDPITPAPLPAHPRHLRLPVAAAALIPVSVAVLLAVILLLASFCLRRARRSTVPPSVTIRRLPYPVLRRATGSFLPSNKLGQGGFGPVFRGVLPSGQAVAVKAMDAIGSLQGEREFHNEIALTAHILSQASRSPHVILPFGYSISSGMGRRHRHRGANMMLVYELMPNGSLQDALLGKRCFAIVQEWKRRHRIAVDIASALCYLHHAVIPPVVHGDVKPSNILLDHSLNAKLSDFGLARIKSGDESVEILPADPAEEEKDDVASVAESVTTMGAYVDDMNNAVETNELKSPEDDEEGGAAALSSHLEVESASGLDRASTDSMRDVQSCSGDGGYVKKTSNGTLTGKDWWWRQDTISEPANAAGDGGSGSVKDYVMEWIHSEIKKEHAKNEWVAPAVTNTDESKEDLKQPKHRRTEWWGSLDPDRGKKKLKKHPAREWWKEEFAAELAEKQKRRAAKSLNQARDLQWWERGADMENRVKKWKIRSWSRGGGASSIDWWIDGGRRSSRDWASGEIPKSGGAVSSTPSMRGTVCYVAPEYGGSGLISEKCDIYSFGVLLLVIISGRRPLQVMASPMSDFEKASLISWARHLAHVGRLLDLVDPAIGDVDHEQALLSIKIALLCIQRCPASRPSSKEVLSMLTGESEAPQLPVEFSPSPPGVFRFKSRSRAQ